MSHNKKRGITRNKNVEEKVKEVKTNNKEQKKESRKKRSEEKVKEAKKKRQLYEFEFILTLF